MEFIACLVMGILLGVTGCVVWAYNAMGEFESVLNVIQSRDGMGDMNDRT